MKRYFLSYSSLTKDYYLDYGCFDRHREFLGDVDEKKLAKLLFDKLPLHRETVIYTQKSLEDSLKNIFSETFKNTRIKFQFEKNLEKIC